MRMFAFPLAALLALFPAQSGAHPHIFVDTSIQFLFDSDEQLAGVRVIWIYDELYSLLITEDLGLDQDFDGQLTSDEIEKLSGFDMNWDEGFAGDVRGFSNEQALDLSRPVEWSATFEEGKIITTHVRALAERVDPRDTELVFRLYDPTFYTAYSATEIHLVEGAPDCFAEAKRFDPEIAYAYLEDRLDEAEATGMDVEMNFPAVGAIFADEVRLICAP